MDSTPDKIHTMRAAAGAISKGKASFTDNLERLADDTKTSPVAVKGFIDRRALALRYLDPIALTKITPKASGPQLMFEVCLDVLGEILIQEPPFNAMQGVIENINAAQQRVADPTLHRLMGYDVEAYFIAREVLAKIMPDLKSAWQGRHSLDNDPENLARATAKSLPHFLLEQRLTKNLDLLAMVLNPKGRDLNAFAWMLSRQIQDEPTDEEFFLYSVFINDPDALELALLLSNETLLDGNKKNPDFASLRDAYVKIKLDKTKTEIDHLTHLSRTGPHAQRRQAKKKLRRLRIQNADFHISAGRVKNRIFEKFKKRAKQDVYMAARQNKEYSSTIQSVLDGLYIKFAEELRHTNRAARLLAQQLRAAYETTRFYQLEEGMLDPAALSTMVTDPFYQTPYMRRDESDGATLDTAVTILVDNSGSMAEDNKIQLAFLAAERLSFWLSQCGIATEVLGFTTVKGELRHIIYKEMNTPHSQQTSRKMAAMLNRSDMGGNADGEAIEWAHARLLTSAQLRKILMVLSDGLPTDKRRGSKHYPEEYLEVVVDDIEQNSPVEIVGIGIGHDVSKYYRQSIQISEASDLAKAMTTALREIILPPKRSRKVRRGPRAEPMPA